MRRSWSALLAVLLVGLAVPAYGDASPRRSASAELAPGVTHEVWGTGRSLARVHLARVDAAALRVVQSPSGGRETTTALCRRTPGCAVAINGDFFTADGPVGGVISDGRLLRSPSRPHEQLSFGPLRASSGLDWRAVLRAPDGAELELDGVNVPLSAEAAVVYTSSYGVTTPACGCREVVLTELDGPVGQLGVPTTVARVGQGSGRTPLESGTVVVAAAPGAAAQRLQAVVSAGTDLTVTMSVPEPVEQSIGVHPVLLQDGQVAPVDREDPMLRDPHPRSVVAWDRAGTVWLAAFDGRQERGRGPTGDEVVGFLQSIGATDAVMLDGGGSTTLATGAGPLNRPSEGAERAVSNALVVVAEEVAALRVAAPAPVAAPAVAAAVPPPASAPPVPTVPAPVVPAPTAVEVLPEVAPVAPASASPAVVTSAPFALSPAALEPRVRAELPVPPQTAVLIAAAVAALAVLCWVASAWVLTAAPRRQPGPMRLIDVTARYRMPARHAAATKRGTS